jgi:DNA-binding HxlR family transcriptional regulator
MRYDRKRPVLDPCPVETVLSIVSGKWKVRVLYLLWLEAMTFGELRKATGGVSQQVLSSVLQELEADGIVRRARSAGGKMVSTYGLSAEGRDLVALLMPVAEWGNARLAERGIVWQPPVPPRRAMAATPLSDTRADRHSELPGQEMS